MDFRKNTDMAIPLCLPNNCRWNSATSEYNKTGEKRSSLYVVDEALQKLRTVKGNPLIYDTCPYKTIEVHPEIPLKQCYCKAHATATKWIVGGGGG